MTIFAGLPATRVLGGTSFVTTDPAAIIAFSPIVIPQSIVELAPIDAPFFTVVGITFQPGLTARGFLSFVKHTCGPMKTSSSIVTPLGIKTKGSIAHLSPIVTSFCISTNAPILQ